MNHEHAAEIGIRALQHISSDEDLLVRFLGLTGLTPQTLREAATDPSFLGSVLDFFLTDETQLLAFTANASLPPETIAKAKQVLINGDQNHEWT